VGYTTIKVSKQVKERLDRYARVRGLTLAGAVDRLLSEEEVREELEEIKQLLKEQNELLREILSVLRRKEITKVIEREKAPKKEERREEARKELPSFVVWNPWVKVISEK